MAELRTEEEQIEAIQRWWKEKGKSTVVQVLAVAALYFGWQAWQGQQIQTAEAASGVYQQLLEVNTKLETNKTDEDYATANHLITTLKVDYSSSTYAQYGAMMSAKYLNDQKKYSDALEEINWVIAADSDQAITLAASLRKARILSNSGDNSGALAVLQLADKGEFSAAFYELEGDLLFAEGDLAAAKIAYQEAANNSPIGAANPLLTIKLDSLVVPSTPVSVSAEEEL